MFDYFEPFDVLAFKTFEPFERFLQKIKVQIAGDTSVHLVGQALGAVEKRVERISNKVFDATLSADVDRESIMLAVYGTAVVIMLQQGFETGSDQFRQEVSTVAKITSAWGLATNEISVPERVSSIQ
jgi:hypothetical protein